MLSYYSAQTVRAKHVNKFVTLPVGLVPPLEFCFSYRSLEPVRLKHHRHCSILLVDSTAVNERQARRRFKVVSLRLSHDHPINYEGDGRYSVVAAGVRGREFELEDVGTLNAERFDQGIGISARDLDWIGIDCEVVLDQGCCGCSGLRLTERTELSR